MDNSKPFFSSVILLIDFTLLNISYFTMNNILRDTIALSGIYMKLLLAFYIAWLIISIFMKKFHWNPNTRYSGTILLYTESTVFIVYAISVMVVVIGLPTFSRLHIFGTFFLFLTMEIALYTIYYKWKGIGPVAIKAKTAYEIIFQREFSFFLLITDFVLITIAFFGINYHKKGTLALTIEYEKILLLTHTVWFPVSMFTRKFDKRYFKNFSYALSSFIKSLVIMSALMAVCVFAFRLFYYSRLHIFGTFFLLFLLETTICYLYFITRPKHIKEGDIETAQEILKLFKQSLLSPPKPDRRQHDRRFTSVHNSLKTSYLKDNPKLYNFIKKTINMAKINTSEASVLDTDNIFNVESINDHSLSLFINLHRVNDMRWINKYFLNIFNKLLIRGYFIGKADTIETYNRMLYRIYPKNIGNIIYIINFIFFRFFPKIPVIKNLYFKVTKGESRVISKAELVGRLYFCGFKVIGLKEIDYSLYYIAQKAKTPSIDKNPSYSPIINLKKIGYLGNLIIVHKFRTMHPYSEYMQQYIYEHHRLASIGKFKNDFRVTGWGKFMRRFWIDELPQLIDFLRGETSLFGVRALTPHYFKLYPMDLQNLRIKFKPGLIPPFYADLPNSFDEILESEWRYLLQKQKHPFATDIKYICWALFNIIFKNARGQ